MRIEDLHPEDVRAAIRKRFGTIKDFEAENGLPVGGVHDILRGRTSERVRQAVESVLMEQVNTASRRRSHSQNTRAAA